ncbi:MAG: manganese-dependent inorganic pyrophosphatase [Nanoarchaeota archaeon]|nr:manganese-dependent inorganic pyrophosphatase [Nanoarchaeota archaeon]
MTTYKIIGHKNPDTDAICSAIAMQEFMKAKGHNAQAYRLGELNKETQFVMNYTSSIIPELVTSFEEKSELILVDHNEKAQSIDNLEQYSLYYIVDHHKFSLETSAPLYIRAEPIGSTCSIVAKMFSEEQIEISKELATLMIAGIVSDTLYFRSPTTTHEDRELVEMLNEIAQIEDVEKFSLDMFSAKSDLGDITAIEMIQIDYKEFEFNGNMYGIGVMETTNAQYGINRLSEIKEALTQIQERDNLTGVMFSVVDILDEKNYSICSNEEFGVQVQQAFSSTLLENGFLDLGGALSRKKQIVPTLKNFLEG